MKEDIQYHLDYGELEANKAFVAERNGVEYTSGKNGPKNSLFWRFPSGKGSILPWRRRLWELQNNSDHE